MLLIALSLITAPAFAADGNNDNPETVEEATETYEVSVRAANQAYLEDLRAQESTLLATRGEASATCASAIGDYESAWREHKKATDAMVALGDPPEEPGVRTAHDAYVQDLEGIVAAQSETMEEAQRSGIQAAATYTQASGELETVRGEIKRIQTELHDGRAPTEPTVRTRSGYTSTGLGSLEAPPIPVPYDESFAGCPNYNPPPDAEAFSSYETD